MATQVSLNSGAVSSAGSLKLQTNGTTDAVTIDTAQNMGLGVTPSAWQSYLAFQMNAGSILSYSTNDYRMVQNTLRTGGAWKYINNGYANTYLQDGSSGGHSWYIAPSGTAGNAITFTQAMTLDASGNLGVGTTSPSSRLHVSGTTGTIQSIIENTSASGYSELNLKNSGASGRQYSIGVGGNGTSSPYANNLYFYDGTAAATRMVLDSNGNLLVGKTAADDSTTGFAYRSSGYISVARNGGAPCYFNRTGTDGSVVEIANDGSTVGSISVSGSTTAYNTSSDYRLKHDITPMTDALAKVAALKPVIYKWNSDGSNGEGFIAHELADVCPDAVHGEKDAVDEDGNPVYQGIDTSFLVATLTAAIQELNAKVEAQAVEIAALKG